MTLLYHAGDFPNFKYMSSVSNIWHVIWLKLRYYVMHLRMYACITHYEVLLVHIKLKQVSLLLVTLAEKKKLIKDIFDKGKD